MWWILAALVAAVVAYVFARPYLIEHVGFWRKFCAWVDPLVTSWLSKSRQIALARLTAILPFLAYLSGAPIDWQMIADAVIQHLPEAAQPMASKIFWPLIVWAYGEAMRRVTSEPLAEKA